MVRPVSFKGFQKGFQGVSLTIGLLLLGGVAQLLTRTRISIVDTFMFSANFMIYIGLLIDWIQSMRSRLLPTRARRYFLSSAVLMIIHLLIRVLRFRILTDITVRRYVDYSYNIPLVLVPTLFLTACISINQAEESKSDRTEVLLVTSACALLLFILTNDLHRLFYSPTVPLSEFHCFVGTYTYGPLFYFMYAWIAVTLLAGFLILIRKTWKQNTRSLYRFAAVILVWAGFSLLNWLVFTPLDLLRMYHAPEIHIFGMLGLFEVCIRSRLIPYNENYSGFFSNLGLPVRITDETFATVYETNIPITASDNDLILAAEHPVFLDEDTLLSGMKIHPGYVFWIEDQSELHRESCRLASANEILSEENDLIAVENELKEKKAHLDAQDQVYERIASALYPKQKQIETLLESTSPESDDFPAVLAECCVLNVYCKRKSNLMLLEQDNLPHPNRELFLALQESACYLKCCGIDAAATGEEYTRLPLEQIQRLYDSFETLVECFLPYMKKMTVSLFPAGVRMAMEVRQCPALPETECSVDCRESEGCLFLTVKAEGGEER